jgi:hypothetical protein
MPFSFAFFPRLSTKRHRARPISKTVLHASIAVLSLMLAPAVRAGSPMPKLEVLRGPDTPVIDAGSPGAEEIQGGFESGMCVKVGNIYHAFPTERAGQKGSPATFDRVKTRIGHWTSTDALHWTRQETLYQASGNYAVSPDDNPANDRRGALWSFNPVYNEAAGRWNAFYVGYTVDREVFPNHSFGRIWRAESVQAGPEGIGGPYRDLGIVMEPGLDTQLWEGRQGVQSFFPYQTERGWMAFYGGAIPFLKREDYPKKGVLGWNVGLAQSTSLEGPWTRLDETVNPVTSIHPKFVENPLVYRLPDGRYIAVFDGGPAKLPLPEPVELPNKIGYTFSADGVHWEAAQYLDMESAVKKWWDTMRTPLCLIAEGNDEYTILYTAVTSGKRFRPMGMVRVKMVSPAPLPLPAAK